VLVGLLALAVPGVRHDVIGRGHSKLNRITGGRSGLVKTGLQIAADHPIVGVGAGGFSKAYATRHHFVGPSPKRSASHTTPVTVVAEEGVIGLALYVWLLVAAFAAAFVRARRSRIAFAAGLILVAVAVQSLFYNAFFEDPITWAALGLIGLVTRLPSTEDVEAAQVEHRPHLEQVAAPVE